MRDFHDWPNLAPSNRTHAECEILTPLIRGAEKYGAKK
jgi:hypothetical protein